MKLLSCHIHGFGALCGRDLTFGPLTSFCEENGYGKTTIASFLKAMFYGLDSDRSNSLFNERRHFLPFSGAPFGGYVVFQAGGHTYKIERYFDEKSERKDTLTLYCDNRIIAAPVDLGESFFGLDKNSFERTFFLTASDVGIASAEKISTRLNNFVEGSDDTSDLSAALGRLDTMAKEYRKSKNGGRIPEESARVNDLDRQIAQCEAIAAGLPAKYARLSETEGRIRELNALLSRAQSENVVLNDWEHYDALCRESERMEKELLALQEGFPAGIPQEEELDAALSALQRDRELRASGTVRLTPAEEETYAALCREFAPGVPDEAALSEAEARCMQLSETKRKLQALQDEPSETPKFNTLPDEKVLSRLEEQTNAYKSAQARLDALPARGTSFRSAKYAAAAVLSALLLLGGIAVLFFQTIAGVVLLCIGGAGILIDGFLYLNKKSSLPQGEDPARRGALRAQEEAEGKIRAILLPYGYTFENGVLYAAASFSEDVRKSAALHRREAERLSSMQSLKAEKEETERALSAFFSRFGLPDGGEKGLAQLRADILTYRSLCTRKQAQTESAENLQKKIGENLLLLNAFCAKYDVRADAESFKALQRAVADVRAAQKSWEEQKARAEKFRIEKGLSVRPETGKIDTDRLRSELTGRQEEKTALLGEISDDERDADGKERLLHEREEANARLERYKMNHDLLTKTMQSLTEAQRRLKGKYMDPVRETFSRYADILEKTVGEKIVIGDSFEMRFLRDGKERSEEYLSAGQRTVLLFCLRLALIDNMYESEKPFLILDDPFTGLDDAHMKKVRQLLSVLTQHMQIVYFCCHDSRAI